MDLSQMLLSLNEPEFRERLTEQELALLLNEIASHGVPEDCAATVRLVLLERFWWAQENLNERTVQTLCQILYSLTTSDERAAELGPIASTVLVRLRGDTDPAVPNGLQVPAVDLASRVSGPRTASRLLSHPGTGNEMSRASRVARSGFAALLCCTVGLVVGWQAGRSAYETNTTLAAGHCVREVRREFSWAYEAALTNAEQALSDGRVDEAAVQAMTARDLAMNEVYSSLLLGEACMRERKYSEATKWYEEGIGKARSNGDRWVLGVLFVACSKALVGVGDAESLKKAKQYAWEALRRREGNRDLEILKLGR